MQEGNLCCGVTGRFMVDYKKRAAIPATAIIPGIAVFIGAPPADEEEDVAPAPAEEARDAALEAADDRLEAAEEALEAADDRLEAAEEALEATDLAVDDAPPAADVTLPPAPPIPKIVDSPTVDVAIAEPPEEIVERRADVETAEEEAPAPPAPTP